MTSSPKCYSHEMSLSPMELMSFKWPEFLPTKNKDTFTLAASLHSVELFARLNAGSEVTTRNCAE